jgi:acetamidase/formamidase
MKNLNRAVLLLVALSTPAAAEEISGAWELYLHVYDDTQAHRLKLEAQDGKLSGTVGTNRDVTGTLKAGKVELEVRFRDNKNVWATLTGSLQGSEMAGEGKWFETPIRWKAKRPASKPAAPRTHDFTPREFHRYFSAAIPPVLHIFPGDTVRTWSVDAGGRDREGNRRSLGGNPQTGPFYVEGAMPGDTLVVRLNRVRLNRDSAGSGQSIVGNALTPGYLQRLKRVEGFDSNWRLDRERGLAMLAKPSERLKSFAVPLQPMLGCVSVAPARGVVPTTDSGPMGGNMDYNQIREGTTVYLPVAHAGALLFVGDGHAVEGDGELTGDALETSMDIEFSVDVVPAMSTGAPRAEDAEHLMAIGIAGSLDEALRRATSALADWLEREYKLDAAETAIVLGTVIRYDVADLVGTQVSIVAKLPKKYLAQLPRPGTAAP